MSESSLSAERSSPRRRRTPSPTPRRQSSVAAFGSGLTDFDCLPALRSSDSSPPNVSSAAVTSVRSPAERPKSKKPRLRSTTSSSPSARPSDATVLRTRRQSAPSLSTRLASRSSPPLLKRSYRQYRQKQQDVRCRNDERKRETTMCTTTFLLLILCSRTGIAFCVVLPYHHL